MPWSTDFQQESGLVEIVFSGRVSATDLKQSTSDAVALGKASGSSRFLADLTGCEVSASMVDVYELPVSQYVDEDVSRESRIALVSKKAGPNREAVQFYETVCVNRGWLVHVFETAEEAIAWLRRN